LGVLVVDVDRAAFTSGLLFTSPEYSVAVPVTLFATQNGLVRLNAKPHGSRSLGAQRGPFLPTDEHFLHALSTSAEEFPLSD
jgi:hypothetical protein